MVKFAIKDLSIWFGSVQALRQVGMEIQAHEILSIIGPSNSGKTTFLRMLNRLNELQDNFKMQGEIKFDGVEALKDRIAADIDIARTYFRDKK